MRRGVITFLFAILLVTSFVAASTTCISEDHVIFKLEQLKNSHVETYNGANNYPIKICSNTSITDRTCNENNTIFWVKSSTNSHASLIETPEYNTPICHQGLICRATQETVCAEREELIASMYQNTSSHLSAGDNPLYPIKICCSFNGFTLTNMYWANSAGNKTTEAYEDSLVKMVAEGEFYTGQVIDYAILDDDGWYGWFNDEVTTGTHIVTAAEVAAKKVSISWTTAWNDANASIFIEANPEYFFKFESGVSSVISKEFLSEGYEGLLNSIKGIDTSITETKIVNPVDREIYMENQNISLEWEVTEGANPIEGIYWDLGDGRVITREQNENGTVDLSAPISVNYPTGNQKTIILTTKDSLGQSYSSRVTFLVPAEGILTFAYISRPANKVSILADDEGRVEYSAEGSYVIKKEGDSLTCIVGSCPLSVSGRSISTGSQQPLANNDVGLIWSFSDGQDPINGKATLGGIEPIRFVEAGFNNEVVLNMTYENASSTAKNIYNLFYKRITCSPEGKWMSPSFQVYTAEGCELDDDGRICSPPGYECINDELVVTNKFLCSEYNESEQDCEENSNYGAAISSVGRLRTDGRTCGDIIGTPLGNDPTCQYSLQGCACKWDEIESKCNADYSIRTTNCEVSNTPSDIGSCKIIAKETIGSCEEGVLTYSWEAVWSWSDTNPDHIDPLNQSGQCSPGVNRIICPAQVKLPFFSLNNILTVIVIIALIYYFMIRRGKVSKKKHKDKKK